MSGLSYNNHMKQNKYVDRKKVILTDCDGVLLDWEYSFKVWMVHRGYTIVDPSNYKISKMFGIDDALGKSLIRQFNESAAIGFLPGLRDAIYYVKKLHEKYGIVFHCLTSLSTDPNAKALRQMNLDKLFGQGVFEELVCADTGADKHELLEPYRDSGCLWIEDKPENAELGIAYGLSSILMGHNHNINYSNPMIPRVWKWKHIYDTVSLWDTMEG